MEQFPSHISTQKLSIGGRFDGHWPTEFAGRTQPKLAAAVRTAVFDRISVSLFRFGRGDHVAQPIHQRTVAGVQPAAIADRLVERRRLFDGSQPVARVDFRPGSVAGVGRIVAIGLPTAESKLFNAILGECFVSFAFVWFGGFLIE